MKVVGGWPGRNVIGLNGAFGVRQAAFAVGGPFDNPFLNDLDGGDATTEFVAVVSALPGSGTVAFNDDGGFSHAGAADGTYATVFTLYSWAQGGPLTQHGTPETITTTFGTVTPAAAITSTLSMGAFTGVAGMTASVSLSASATMGAFTSSAVIATSVGLAITTAIGPFTGQAQIEITGDVVVGVNAYATAQLFIAKYGFDETTQLLADEERLLTKQLLKDALAGTWTGTPTAEEKAAAKEALARLRRELATASSFMDGYLRSVVTLPLPPGDANATTLETCCLALARAELADDPDNRTEQMATVADTWRKWLKDIAGGRVQLVKADGTQPTPTRGVRGGQAATRFDWDRFGRH